MNKVYFYNKGAMDMRAIRTFGISAKEMKNPIGFFGTGLKYAIAILMREGCSVTIYADNKEYKFETVEDSFRGKEFKFIKMNGQELPFTTELGQNWDLWQAFRELYCNALDEGGNCSDDCPTEDTEGQTVIEVESKDFKFEFQRRDEIVISQKRNPSFENAKVKIFDQTGSFIYYRGIKAHELQAPTALTYNSLEHLDLTEDRTLKYPHVLNRKMVYWIASLTDKFLIRKALTTRDTMEQSLDWSWLDIPDDNSKEFLEVVEKLFNDNSDRAPKTLLHWYKKTYKKEDPKNLKDAEMTDISNKQLDKCLRILNNVFPRFENYKVRIVEDLGETTMAYADRDKKTMVIGMKSFDNGTKYLMSTLIEEFFHLESGFSDETREFQTYIFDQLCNVIENKVVREPI